MNNRLTASRVHGGIHQVVAVQPKLRLEIVSELEIKEFLIFDYRLW
jgi:hypothetical protein